MSCGRPKCASIRRPSCTSRTTWASVQRRLLALRGVERLLLRPAIRQGPDRELLVADRLRDDLAVAHLVGVGVHQAGDQRLAEPEARLDRRDLPVGREGVRREQDAGRLREDHPLHDDGHVDLPMVEAVPQAGRSTARSVNSDAQHLLTCSRIAACPDDVQVRVVLAGERGRRQVLRCRARPDGVRGLLAEPGERAGDRRRQIVGDGDPFERPADLRAERRGSRPGRPRPGATAARADRRSPAPSPMIRRKASVVTQKPGGTRMSSIRESSPRFAPLPPTTATCVASIS